MAAKTQEALPTRNTEKLESKWGRTLISAGFTALPDVIFKNQQALKLKPLDIVILLHLASYWWKPDENPWPAKSTLAEAIGVDARTIQRSIKKMEGLGYVKRYERKSSSGDSLSNAYDLHGIIRATKGLAELAIQKRREESRKNKDATV